MKAIRAHQYGGPECLLLDEIDRPVPAAGEVLVTMKAAGVNPADTYMLSGVYGIKPELPYIPGCDASGVVAEVGPAVTKVKVGDRVAIGKSFGEDFTGCYAETILRKEEHLIVLPAAVDFAQATALGVTYPTAHYGLFQRGRASQDDVIFIHGASGSVGSAAIQLAKRIGATVIGSAGTEAGIALIQNQGVDLAVNHSQPGYLDAVMDFTDGKGVDLTLEMLANVNLAADLGMAARKGRVVIIGNRGEATIDARVAMMKEMDIMGMSVWFVAPEDLAKIMVDLTSWLADGSISPVIGKEFALEDAGEAFRYVIAPDAGAHGRVVLVT